MNFVDIACGISDSRPSRDVETPVTMATSILSIFEDFEDFDLFILYERRAGRAAWVTPPVISRKARVVPLIHFTAGATWNES